MHRFISRSIPRLLAIALLTAAPAPLLAQRIAPSGVQRLDVAPSSMAASAAEPRSHVDGAVHGAAVGAVAGALTGVAFYIAAHALYSSQDTQVVTSGDKVILFWWTAGAGALAGGTLGAVIGGIIGR
jgi:hypothetical protein